MKKVIKRIIILSLIILMALFTKNILPSLSLSLSNGKSVNINYVDLSQDKNMYCVSHGRKFIRLET